ncbi:MAG: formylglycine-generating enzyme family protein [Sedimenticola sp.]|nr:formylglycine-generating enzyme family protein [Sedimenticola sp.]
MQAAHPLGQLSALQQMMTELIEPLDESICRSSFHPDIAPLLWYYGKAAYLETLLLRGVVQNETDLTDRVKEIFTPGTLSTTQQWERLPPKEHLLNWALELQDENLMRLANRDQLPSHELLIDDRLTHLICQQRAALYEQMLTGLVAYRLGLNEPYLAVLPLKAATPTVQHVGISQGHYRVGAKQDPAAQDNEQPAQMVKLSNFRIDREPATNGAFLAFMEAGGYDQPSYWSEAGWTWRQSAGDRPYHWKQDSRGVWYGISLNGPADLVADDPVMGISQHEAVAYANWVASLGGELSGAVLQHEFQWEVAMRSQILKPNGRVWEWCANRFEPYSEFHSDPEPIGSELLFKLGHGVLRGSSLHTQPPLQRITYRQHAEAGHQCLFSGTRLVYPPKE